MLSDYLDHCLTKYSQTFKQRIKYFPLSYTAINFKCNNNFSIRSTYTFQYWDRKARNSGCIYVESYLNSDLI